jgi:hypothetical protein
VGFRIQDELSSDWVYFNAGNCCRDGLTGKLKVGGLAHKKVYLLSAYSMNDIV